MSEIKGINLFGESNDERVENIREALTLYEFEGDKQIGYILIHIHDPMLGARDDRITPALIFEVESDEDVIMIEGLEVLVEYRKKGIGRKLINQVINLYPDNVICLHATPDILDANGVLIDHEATISDLYGLQTFYSKCGFKCLDSLLQWIPEEDLTSSFIYTGNAIGDRTYSTLIYRLQSE